MRIADEIARHLSWPMRLTQMRQARQIIMDRLEPAWQAWGDVIVRLSAAAQNGAEVHQVRPDKAEEDFITWLEREVEDPDVRGNAPQDYSDQSSARSVDMKAVELYRCSWCRNPSAVLKRCKGCGGTTCVSDCYSPSQKRTDFLMQILWRFVPDGALENRTQESLQKGSSHGRGR